MGRIAHRAYVISDLHLGGRFPAAAGDRGFRMMDRPDALASFILAVTRDKVPSTELVINGDFIDFLAEEAGEGEWKAFRDEPGEAEAAFRQLAGRTEDGAVFDALAALLDAGHRLTILVGNHDIELTWPEVRAAFEKRVWQSPNKKSHHFNLRWLFDGEALVVGDALIEHGNRYDPANFVDHARLQQVRELRSRHLFGLEAGVFHPPVGSRLVAEVINPVKKDYPFIDLLKPESEAVIGLLLALDPSQTDRLEELAANLAKMPLTASGPPANPAYRQRVAGGASDAGVRQARVAGGVVPAGDTEAEAIAAIFARTVPPGDAAKAQAAIELVLSEGAAIGLARVASKTDHIKAAFSLVRLAFSPGGEGALAKRLPLLRQSIKSLRGDQTFDESVETGKRYLSAARQLAAGIPRPGATVASGFRFIVFGHTHHWKKVDLEAEGATYLNTGTWAKLMKFPADLVSDDDAVARPALEAFVESIRTGTFKTEFVPTYARIDVRGDGVVDSADVHAYEPGAGTLE
jgi:UDP-2,3-diacylglucosamine pyrophosphatase LpxH